MSDMSYTGRDIVDIRKALVEKVPNLTEKWKDFNESDLGMTIIELIAGSQDMMNFYLDTQAFETYLDTAVQKKNIRSILRAMNYRIPLIGSAKGYVRLTYTPDESRKVTVERGTLFTCSEDQRKYVATDTVSKYIGDGYIDVPVMEGDPREKKVTKKSLMTNLTTSGEVSRRINLNLETVADGSVEIIQNGVIWKEVDDALLEYNGGYVFSVHKDSDNKVYILMSCDFIERLPIDEDEEVTIRFLVSSGTAGEVDSGKIDQCFDAPREALISISNPNRTYGAWDEVDLNKAKILARRQARTMGRYITLDDFKNGVETEPYVKGCVVKDWRVDETIQEPYVVKIWAVDWSGESLGEIDKSTLYKKLVDKGVTDVAIRLQDVEYIYFDLDIDLYLKTSKENEAMRIREDVEGYLWNTYQVRNMNFGSCISISMLNSRIKSLSPYIKEVVIRSPYSDVDTTDIQIPRLENVTVNVIK